MNRVFATILLLASVPSFAKDKSKDYRIGTYVGSETVKDGTLTSTLHGDGTTVAGRVYENSLRAYRINVDGGAWLAVTMRQAGDSFDRRVLGDTPLHFGPEKKNPLDFLSPGARVMFRVETHRKLLGSETDMYIPFADNPDKEVKFVAIFRDAAAAAPAPAKPTDNVKAMCDSGRLSPELYKGVLRRRSASSGDGC
jgi:hypothetical protein